MLARVLDKARASLTGKAGDYKYGNPMGQHFFAFTGLAQDAEVGLCNPVRLPRSHNTINPNTERSRT